MQSSGPLPPGQHPSGATSRGAGLAGTPRLCWALPSPCLACPPRPTPGPWLLPTVQAIGASPQRGCQDSRPSAGRGAPGPRKGLGVGVERDQLQPPPCPGAGRSRSEAAVLHTALASLPRRTDSLPGGRWPAGTFPALLCGLLRAVGSPPATTEQTPRPRSTCQRSSGGSCGAFGPFLLVSFQTCRPWVGKLPRGPQRPWKAVAVACSLSSVTSPPEDNCA